MKKNNKKLYIFILNISLITNNYAKETQPIGINFKDALQKYIIEPGWIIRTWLKMPVKTFCDAFAQIVSLMIYNPEIYCETKNNQYNDFMRAHCDIYDDFLQSTYINDNQYLTIEDNQCNTNKISKVSIVNYMKNNDELYKLYCQFYAFYFDLYSKYFIRTVMIIYHDIHTNNICTNNWILLNNIFKILLNIFDHIKTSEYDTQYSPYIIKYHELMDIIKNQYALNNDEGSV